MELSAQEVDIWNIGFDVSPGDCQQLVAQFDDICEEVGRNPDEVEKSMGIALGVSDTQDGNQEVWQRFATS